jgi:hypothetical protein
MHQVAEGLTGWEPRSEAWQQLAFFRGHNCALVAMFRSTVGVTVRRGVARKQRDSGNLQPWHIAVRGGAHSFGAAPI